VRAVQLIQWESEPQLVEVPVPEPGPGQALLRVDAGGLCHSDLHLMQWPADVMPYDPPFTLGHETAGTVAALGPGTSGVSVGDRVLVYSRWGCGRCQACLRGADNQCRRSPGELGGHGGGIGFDGGLAEYMLVPAARYLVPIDGLEPELAAPLSDAALTPYHAITQVARGLRPGATAVVIGVGGIGHMAVQLLRALTPVRIAAVDLRTDALELARAAGAELTLEAAELTPDQLRAELGLGGAAVVFDCVASEATLRLAAGAVEIGGHISYVGRGGGSLAVSPATLPFECSVSLPSWGSIPELSEVVELARSGSIDVEVHRVRLEDAVNTYRQLRRGEIIGRAVVVPGATNETLALT
jgi:alcohol dehydrogenase, propanol-preferring